MHVAAELHEPLRLNELTSCALRLFFNRIRSNYNRNSTYLVLSETRLEKRSLLGLYRASVLELLYGRQPILLPDMYNDLLSTRMIKRDGGDVAKRRIYGNVRAHLSTRSNIAFGDQITVQRYGSCWLYASCWTAVRWYYCKLICNGLLNLCNIERAGSLQSSVEKVDCSEHGGSCAVCDKFLRLVQYILLND